MTLSRIGRASMALVVSVAMGLGMTSCGGGTIGYMWVIGTKDGSATGGQIGGFKIDNYTGNLSHIVGSPFSSGGSNPIMVALKNPGGRYLYVLNAGNATTAGNISLFSIGGDGVLSFQRSFSSQGTVPVWLGVDTSGNYLYVLDQQAPDYATTGNGSITVFSLASDTGRQSLVTNSQVKDANGTNIGYFEVGKKPTQFRSTGSCLYTLDSGDQSVFPYNIGGATGQLTQPTNSSIFLGTANATSVNVGNSYVYVTDAGSALGAPGTINAYTQSNSCSLAPITGGNTPNLASASNPYKTLNSSDNSYLYVLNHSTANTNFGTSSISGFAVQSNGGELVPISDAIDNPYGVGAGASCIAFDPSGQYIYTSDQFANTVTGKRFGPKNGYLSQLTRGSTFPTVGNPTCLVISGSVGN